MTHVTRDEHRVRESYIMFCCLYIIRHVRTNDQLTAWKQAFYMFCLFITRDHLALCPYPWEILSMHVIEYNYVYPISWIGMESQMATCNVQ